MAAALAILLTLVLPGLKKVIIEGIDKLPGEFQLPREQGLLHQLPLELRQRILKLTTPFNNRDHDLQSYEPLRTNLLLPSCLYQTVDSLPANGPFYDYTDFTDYQPPIKYKRAFKPLLLVKRQTYIDMMSTVTTEGVQAIETQEIPTATLVIDYYHRHPHGNQKDSVYVAWPELPLCAHASQEIKLDVLVLIPQSSAIWGYDYSITCQN